MDPCGLFPIKSIDKSGGRLAVATAAKSIRLTTFSFFDPGVLVMLRPTLVLFTVLALASAVPAFGQHSDVEFDYQNNQITIQDAEFSGLDADWLFESEFPVDGLSENFSSDPGFASEVAEGLGINPGDDIFLNFIVSPTLGGALQYHAGDIDVSRCQQGLPARSNRTGNVPAAKVRLRW